MRRLPPLDGDQRTRPASWGSGFEGAHALRSKAEAMNSVAGAVERGQSGTNAPGTALALDRTVQVFTSEHFSRIVQPWDLLGLPDP